MKEDDDILDLHKIRDTNPVVKLLTVFTIVKFLVLLGILVALVNASGGSAQTRTRWSFTPRRSSARRISFPQ